MNLEETLKQEPITNKVRRGQLIRIKSSRTQVILKKGES